MSRETILELVEDIKEALTSEQYKKLLEEVAKVTPLEEKNRHLELRIIIPTCRNVGWTFIRNYCSLTELKLIINKKNISDENWELLLQHKAGKVHVKYLMCRIPQEQKDLLSKFLDYNYDDRITLTYQVCEDEYDEEDECKFRTVDIVTEVEHVFLIVSEKT